MIKSKYITPQTEHRAGYHTTSYHCTFRLSSQDRREPVVLAAPGPAVSREARDWRGSYCEPDAVSQLSCFWSKTAENGRLDGMCHGTTAVFDPDAKVFRIGCPLRPLKADEGLPKIPDDLHQYWYKTGAAQVFGSSLLLNKTVDSAKTDRVSTLLQREGTGNIWHAWMEIMSLTWSLDILRMSRDPRTNAPILTEAQRESAQLVIVDDHDMKPLSEFWTAATNTPIRHINDLGPSEPPSAVIVPFAGGSNPVWQGDWEDLGCKGAPLVRTFVHRVTKYFKIPLHETKDNVTVTFIHRGQSRRLVDEDAHLEALRKAIPHATIDLVDFGNMTLKEQLQTARQTDVLVGAHGAGLTHSMFLERGAAVVELVPNEFTHKGFRNVAQAMDLTYFRTHAQVVPGVEGKGNWQDDPIVMDRQQLIHVVLAAVQSMYSKGLRSHDVM